MKEYFTDDYVKLTRESLKSQTLRAIEKYGAWEETKIFSTSLEFGRQTGKTKAAVELSNSLGGVVIYVGHNLAAAEEFKRRGGKADLYTSIRSNIDAYIRGRSINSNRVSVIFDECDVRTSEMFELSNTISPAMRANGSWGKYIHLIRLGM